MMSDASRGYYKRNVRMGVPGAGASVGPRAMRQSIVSPNTARLNQMRSQNTQASQAVSPLAQIGQALQGSQLPMPGMAPGMPPHIPGPVAGPYVPPPGYPAPPPNFSNPVVPPGGYLPAPPQQIESGPLGGFSRLALPKRPVARQTPFVF